MELDRVLAAIRASRPGGPIDERTRAALSEALSEWIKQEGGSAESLGRFLAKVAPGAQLCLEKGG